MDRGEDHAEGNRAARAGAGGRAAAQEEPVRAGSVADVPRRGRAGEDGAAGRPRDAPRDAGRATGRSAGWPTASPGDAARPARRTWSPARPARRPTRWAAPT